MKILLDMNVTFIWLKFFKDNDYFVRHWSQLGEKTAPDIELMEYARTNNFLVFTHDLDFGELLAKFSFQLPSVVQIRGEVILPSTHGNLLLDVLSNNENLIQNGVLITIKNNKVRIKNLPIESLKPKD